MIKGLITTVVVLVCVWCFWMTAVFVYRTSKRYKRKGNRNKDYEK